MLTSINLILFIIVFYSAFMTFYFWLRKNHYTREVFALSGLTTSIVLGFILILNTATSTSFINSIVDPFGNVSELIPTESVLLLLLFGFEQAIFANAFKKWTGLKSQAQYWQEQHQEQPSVWQDVMMVLGFGKYTRYAFHPHREEIKASVGEPPPKTVNKYIVLPLGWAKGDLKLTQLQICNFRGFEQAQWPLSPQFTLLIGDNGTGKTGILDALATAIQPLLTAFGHATEVKISPSDVRQRTFHKDEQVTFESQYPVEIQMNATIGEQTLSWDLTQDASSDAPEPSGYQSMVNISRALQQAVQDGEDVLLPVIAYYKCNRLWQGHFSDPLDTLAPESRFAGYNDCLSICAGEQRLFAWWKTQTLAALQNKQPSKLLKAIKHAVIECLEQWDDIEYNISEDTLMVSNEQGDTLPFPMLSDGVRNVLVLVADLAHRAALLNPHLGDHVLQQTPGFVLIDEIDMHLHPKWQRRIIEDLKRIFPKVQFIATTHSPFMIQSLRAGELVNLNEQAPEPYSDRSIEDIAEAVMGIEMPQKSERYQQMMRVAEQYYTLLEQASSQNRQQIDQLKEQLDKLLIPYNDNPAFTAYLKLQRAAKLQESE